MPLSSGWGMRVFLTVFLYLRNGNYCILFRIFKVSKVWEGTKRPADGKHTLATICCGTQEALGYLEVKKRSSHNYGWWVDFIHICSDFMNNCVTFSRS
jgi:hypothetical protein